MGTSLAQQVGKAADEARDRVPSLSCFSRIDASDGMSIRRFYRAADGMEQEVCIYRDKWWSKDGGKVQAELYCLVQNVQRSLGGVEQSWLAPDYSRPLHHFQYGLSLNADSPHWTIASIEDVVAFQYSFTTWLVEVATPWLHQFAAAPGVVQYLESQHRFADLARFLLRNGDKKAADEALANYFRSAPRQIDRTLGLLAQDGLLDSDEAEALRVASMQREDHYREAVDDWLAQRGFSLSRGKSL